MKLAFIIIIDGGGKPVGFPPIFCTVLSTKAYLDKKQKSTTILTITVEEAGNLRYLYACSGYGEDAIVSYGYSNVLTFITRSNSDLYNNL